MQDRLASQNKKPSTTNGKREYKSIRLRLMIILIPLGAFLTGLACWVGYQSASSNLAHSLRALPLFQVTTQSERMNQSLERVRDTIFLMAKESENMHNQLDEKYIREKFSFYFRGFEELIQEISISSKDNKGFMLLRDGDDFISLNQEEASSDIYSPYRQILSRTLSPDKVSIFPVVFYSPHISHETNSQSLSSVMRMALKLDDERTLIIGISMDQWRKLLLPTTNYYENEISRGSKKRFQLAYFFDNSGWMLTELSNQGNLDWRPDIARQGYTGDMGRAGYDAAFRPWTEHENYWHMVTDVRESRTGTIKSSAAYYPTPYKAEKGFLCYAPILFSPDKESEARVIGGIGIFETSPLFLESFLKLSGNLFATIILSAIILSLVISRFCRRYIAPFEHTADRLQAMFTSRNLHYLREDKSSYENKLITSTINNIISVTKGQSEQIEIMTKTMQNTHAPLPASLEKNRASSLLLGEFDLVGSSKEIAIVREDIHKAANAGTDVLVWGETGTGKELVATAIHKASANANAPFISINCGALDENLLLDSLFGHVTGAFSDAKEARKGAFLAAEGGTLHLDEIGNASPKVQQSLLRALSARRIRPLGSDIEIEFSTRVVAATNVDLKESVKEGLFRQDLYYRLAIISIETPPLRKIKADIPELAAFCILEACERMGKKRLHISRGALKLLQEHDWPGNVREFKNCLTRAVAYAEGETILPQDISFDKTASSKGQDLLKDANKEDPKSKNRGRGSHAAEYLWPSPARKDFHSANIDYSDKKNEKINEEKLSPKYDENSKYNENSEHDENSENKERLIHKEKFPSTNLRETEKLNLDNVKDEIFSDNGHQENSHKKNGTTEGKESLSKEETLNYLKNRFQDLIQSETINERQLYALKLAKLKGSFTRLEYEESCGADVSNRTLQNDLRQLMELELIERHGSGPGTFYSKSEK